MISYAITVLCISLLLDYIHYNNKFHLNSLPDLNMPENHHQPQADSPLTAWVKMHIGSLYYDESREETDFRTIFDSTFSNDASIYINHEKMSRGDFESKLRSSRSALSQSSTIDWKEVLEIPTHSEKGDTSTPNGIVTGFFVVTRSMKFKIRASAAQFLSYNSFSARISQEGSQTKMTELFLTYSDRPAPIHLPAIPTSTQS